VYWCRGDKGQRENIDARAHAERMRLPFDQVNMFTVPMSPCRNVDSTSR
jgi:hypothetical protein